MCICPVRISSTPLSARNEATFFHSFIFASPTRSKAGTEGMMGPDVTILDRNHKFDRTDIPIGRQGNTERKPTVIEDDVWIGCQVLIMPGRRIRKGSIIAGGCVLCKDFPEYSIVGGNPSKLIRSRKEEVKKE